MRKRRGVSPILSIMILISIATVGGGLMYSIQNQFLTVALNALEIRVTDLKIEKDANGACYFQALFHNSGTEPISKISLKTTLDNGEDFVRTVDNFGPQFVPGNSTKFELIPMTNATQCGNFTISNTYSFRINASSTDSTFATIALVQVTNVTRS